MKQIQFGSSTLQVPVIAVGCMRIPELSAAEARTYIETALGLGLNFFDHADIYGGGKSEQIFGEAIVSPSTRQSLIIQSKCGIGKGFYDYSKAHIVQAVEGSLKRLGTDYLDALLLHRPDALVEPEEVAAAFDELHQAGKVLHFGVSNHKPMQIELLKKYVKQPIVANQLQYGPAHAYMVSNGINVNNHNDLAIDRDGSVLDYCRLHDITIQPWSPFQHGMIEGIFFGNENYKALNEKLAEVAARYGVSDTTMALAWILRHPAKMQPIVGTMNKERLAQCAAAAEIAITRQEWYEIYLSGGNTLP